MQWRIGQEQLGHAEKMVVKHTVHFSKFAIMTFTLQVSLFIYINIDSAFYIVNIHIIASILLKFSLAALFTNYINPSQVYNNYGSIQGQ